MNLEENIVFIAIFIALLSLGPPCNKTKKALLLKPSCSETEKKCAKNALLKNKNTFLAWGNEIERVFSPLYLFQIMLL